MALVSEPNNAGLKKETNDSAALLIVACLLNHALNREQHFV
jgi:hypothetical protein